MRAAKECGLRLPDDLAITGFDDIPFARDLDPPLTTVYVPKELLGELAVRKLIERINNPGPPRRADGTETRSSKSSCSATPPSRCSHNTPHSPITSSSSTPAGAQALQFIADLTTKDQVTPPASQLASGATIASLFTGGQLAMAYGNQALVPTFEKTAGLD